MATRTSLLAFSALLALCVPAAAQEELPPAERYHVRLEYLWWSPQPAGQLQKGFSNQRARSSTSRRTSACSRARPTACAARCASGRRGSCAAPGRRSTSAAT